MENNFTREELVDRLIEILHMVKEYGFEEVKKG